MQKQSIKERFAQLSEKLSSTRHVEADLILRQDLNDNFGLKIQNLEEKIQECGHQNSKRQAVDLKELTRRYDEVSDTVKRLRSDLLANKELRDQKFAGKINDLLTIEKNFADTIDTEIKVRLNMLSYLFHTLVKPLWDFTFSNLILKGKKKR